jgi:thioredoxin-dependent peroxiredoxin
MKFRSGLVVAGLLVGARSAAAQDPMPLQAGDTAPDFVLQAATREGVQEAPVRLSELRDQTVVIAFFYKARTSG